MIIKTKKQIHNFYRIMIIVFAIGNLIWIFMLISQTNLTNDVCRLVESERRLINKQFDLIETLEWVQDHNLSFTRVDNELKCPERVWGKSQIKIINEE